MKNEHFICVRFWRIPCFMYIKALSTLIDICWFCLQVDLLRGQKADKVDVSLQPEELELMENVVPAK